MSWKSSFLSPRHNSHSLFLWDRLYSSLWRFKLKLSHWNFLCCKRVFSPDFVWQIKKNTNGAFSLVLLLRLFNFHLPRPMCTILREESNVFCQPILHWMTMTTHNGSCHDNKNLMCTNWVFSKLFTWIQVITWITHTEFGWIRTIQGPNSSIFRTIQSQTQPFLEQCNWPISGELKLVCVIHVITVIQVGSFEKTRIVQKILFPSRQNLTVFLSCQRRNVGERLSSIKWMCFEFG